MANPTVSNSSASSNPDIQVRADLTAAGNIPFVRLDLGSGATESNVSTSVPVSGTVSVTGVATEATLSTLNGKVTACNTGAVTVSAALPAGNNNIGDVDIASVPAPLSTSGGGAEATALRVTIANDSTGVLSVDDNGSSITVDGTVTANLAAGTNNIGDVDVLSVPAPLSTTGNGTAATALRVTLASDSTGVSAVTQSGSWTVQPGNTANTTPWLVTPTPGTTGGWSKASWTAQTTTVRTVKGSAGTFGGYYIYNPNTTTAYVQIFDVSGTVTLGTTVPDLTLGIPGATGGVAANVEFTNGINFANAIKFACTTTATGLTAPGTGLDVNMLYK